MSRKENPCTLYAVNIIIDCTLGVLFLYFFLKLLSYILSKKLHLSGLQTGHYGDPPSIKPWLKQLAVYLSACFLMKCLVVALFSSAPQIFRMGDWLIGWLAKSVDAQVIFTMMILPCIMNILQVRSSPCLRP